MSCRNLCKRKTDLGDDLDGLDLDTDHQELLQPVEWLQPSCTSGGTYNADADARSTETEGKIECPTCFKQFPIDEVSLHADECADAFWERVGGESEITLQNNVEDGLSQKDLKSEILQLRLRHLKENVHISVQEHIFVLKLMLLLLEYIFSYSNIYFCTGT